MEIKTKQLFSTKVFSWSFIRFNRPQLGTVLPPGQGKNKYSYSDVDMIQINGE